MLRFWVLARCFHRSTPSLKRNFSELWAVFKTKSLLQYSDSVLVFWLEDFLELPPHFEVQHLQSWHCTRAFSVAVGLFGGKTVCIKTSSLIILQFLFINGSVISIFWNNFSVFLYYKQTSHALALTAPGTLMLGISLYDLSFYSI